MGLKVILIVNKKRPVNLDISTISLPVPGIVSFLHRVSGIFLFAGMAALLWMLGTSLDSPEGFASVRDISSSLPCKIILWTVLAALAYHTVAGVRHLFMDCGVGESLNGGRAGAKIVLFVAVVLMVLAGFWVW